MRPIFKKHRYHLHYALWNPTPDNEDPTGPEPLRTAPRNISFNLTFLIKKKNKKKRYLFIYL